MFSNAIACVGELDCLCALAIVSEDTQQGPMCKPTILTAKEAGGRPVLEMKEMRHPCVQYIMSEQDRKQRKFIPNNVLLGKPHTLLITGPNMGGKSTLLR